MSRVLCCLFLVLGLVLGVSAGGGPTSQPTVWATKPDAAAFEKIVNDRLVAGQSYIDKMLGVKGSRPACQDRKSTRLNSSHEIPSRMPSSA